MTRYAAVLFVCALAACSKTDGKGAPPPSGATPTTVVTKPPEDMQTKRNNAIAAVKDLKSPLVGEARNTACSAMRTLASSVNNCAECRTTYAKVLVEQAASDLAICSASNLPPITEDAAALCEALVTTYTKKPSAVLVGSISMQGALCKPQFDTLVTAVVAQMGKYDDKYGDISAADLMYLQRLAAAMSPDQKAKLSAAAKSMSAKAKAKNRTNMVNGIELFTKALG